MRITLEVDPHARRRIVAKMNGLVRDVVPPATAAAYVKRMEKLGVRVDYGQAVAKIVAEVVAAQKKTSAEFEARIAKPEWSGLIPFQRVGSRFLAQHSRAIIADDMGLGKSVQVLAALPENAAAIVVCPASAKGVWPQECLRWRPDLEPIDAEEFFWPDPGQLVVVTYEALPEPPAQPPKEDFSSGDLIDQAFQSLRGEKLHHQIPRPMHAAPDGVHLVADEAHMVKGKKSQRGIRFREVARAVRANGGVNWGATATPLLNTPEELWTVLDSFGLAEDAYGNIGTFRSLFRAKVEEKFAGRDKETGLPRMSKKWVFPDPRQEPFEEGAAARLATVMIRRTKDEVLPDLPPKRYQTIPIHIPLELRQKIEAVTAKEDLLDKIAREEFSMEDDMEEESPRGGAHSVARRMMAEAKIPAMLEQVELYEDANEPLLVWSAHKEPIFRLDGRKGWAVIHGGILPKKRAEIAKKFQEGKLRGIGLTIQAGGVALTLTRAAFALFLDRCYTPALNEQAEDRIRRIGQVRPVLITDLTLDLPVEKRLLEINARKRATIAASVEAARRTS